MTTAFSLQLFDGLDSGAVEAIQQKITLAQYQRDQFLFYTGDKADCIFLLYEGMVKVAYGNLRGDEKTVMLFQSGDIFGDLFVGKYRHRIGMAIAMQEVTVGKLQEQDLLDLCQQYPQLAINYFRHMADAQRETLARMHALMHVDARTRLLGTLLSISRRYCCTADDGWFTVPESISQEDIAHFTCLNRSTVNVLINELRRQKILGGSGRKLTVNRHAVRDLLEDAGMEILE